MGSNSVKDLNEKVITKLKDLKDKEVISDENCAYLKPEKEAKIGRFYLHPKIHKRLYKVPGRPVVSNSGTPTKTISEFLDFYLQPEVKTLPYVIEDTTDFLCRLKEVGDIQGGAIICSIDVVGLYPHIPHDEGLESMRSVLNDYNRNIGIDGQLPVEDLIDLAKVILKNNYFEFEDKIYHQILGTAIGTKFPPSFINIFMSKLEERMISEYHLDPLVWWSFSNDVFFHLASGEGDLT